jgi:hypothetical protein
VGWRVDVARLGRLDLALQQHLLRRHRRRVLAQLRHAVARELQPRHELGVRDGRVHVQLRVGLDLLTHDAHGSVELAGARTRAERLLGERHEGDEGERLLQRASGRPVDLAADAAGERAVEPELGDGRRENADGARRHEHHAITCPRRGPLIGRMQAGQVFARMQSARQRLMPKMSFLSSFLTRSACSHSVPPTVAVHKPLSKCWFRSLLNAAACDSFEPTQWLHWNDGPPHITPTGVWSSPSDSMDSQITRLECLEHRSVKAKATIHGAPGLLGGATIPRRRPLLCTRLACSEVRRPLLWTRLPK